MFRVTLGVLGLLWGVQFLVFRERWTRYLTPANLGGAPEWFPRTFPYIGFALGVVWSIVLFTTGLFGAY
jgi:hypothetical protein